MKTQTNPINSVSNKLQNRVFYTLKPFIPRKVQILLRRKIAAYKLKKYSDVWPIDPNSGDPPEGWTGWPDGNKFAFVLSHDVDTKKGYNNVLKLASLEEQMGFRSCFNFVPERYGKIEESLRDELVSRGFAVGIHGLKHDGKLFSSRTIFKKRAKIINDYIRAWNVTGFSSPAMHHQLEWMQYLDIEQSISTFDTDPFEPQQEGVGTIFPLLLEYIPTGKKIVELPCTMPQDFTLFIVLEKNNIQIWIQKLEWIIRKNGMVLINTHPDYMSFGGSDHSYEQYPVSFYENLLKYIKRKHNLQYWNVVPSVLAKYAKSNASNKLHF